ncbi:MULTISPECIES: ABC transporter ATP-binding protein [Prochlorococcus]|uniref:Putative ABC transporter n=1 Tax=Prochlorococcus marinus str. MIT 9116 TaxID=167544 RepID=A0A0A1ZNP2_PROMR|nr:ATP-binding cassette domain-containing protein [Prochlorococcus marinus]KGF89117.1 putative ABC transporter [Prochlorococcus marinus str. MIT 9107]KGF89874.1 putative ABC transporter [Prochlorococcus marinus str. MIT 9116]KGF95204.1 putative ABC transporter [Prochlorococcus marinus str. MIT 9123]
MKKSKHAVETKNLSISWGEVNVLNQLNFKLNIGERLAIVGPSGSGKSTILKILAGLILPTKGELRIFGEKQTYLRLDQTNPPDVRLVFQNPALLGSLTIAENVGFILNRNKKISKKLIHEIVCKCLAEVGLFNVENKLPNELSGGMQKRVSFARALITDQTLNARTNPLLLFDEPTAGLDPIASSRIEDLINKTNEKTKGTSIVVSHVLSTIERTSDKVLMLYEGKFRWAGSMDEFKKSNDPYVFQFRHGKLAGPMQPKEI